MTRLEEKYVLRHADRTAALSEMVRQDIADHFDVKPDRAVTIYNPCYADIIREKNCIRKQERQFPCRLKGNAVISAGRFDSSPYLALSDIFAFSSTFEGLGDILAECMAIGLPVIFADCKYGPKELLAPQRRRQRKKKTWPRLLFVGHRETV